VARFYAQAGGSFDNRFQEAGMETRTTTRLREQDKRILDKKTFAHLATLMPDRSPFRQMGEQRVKIYIQPEVVKGANE
jgi:hypothetical protein